MRERDDETKRPEKRETKLNPTPLLKLQFFLPFIVEKENSLEQ